MTTRAIWGMMLRLAACLRSAHGPYLWGVSSALALSLLTCLPTLPPIYEVSGFSYLGTRSESTASELQVFMAPGLTRADALPGDMVHLVPYFADLDGVLEPGSVDVDWFFCWGDCPDMCWAGCERLLSDKPCDAPTLGTDEFCHIGRGPELELPLTLEESLETLLNSLEDGRISLPPIYIAVVAKDPRSTNPRSCVERLIHSSESLADCQLALRTIYLGPSATLVQLAAQAGINLPDRPPESYTDYPNFNPVVVEFAVTEKRANGERIEHVVAPRGQVRVARGAQVSARPRLLAVEQTFGMYAEYVWTDWRVIHDYVEVLEVELDEARSYDPNVPADDHFGIYFTTEHPRAGEAPILLVVTVYDTRASEVVEWIRVDVEDS
ncbi:MAG: hypothetical protein KC636_34880 [Myxococcales bacterium]|nr:hypothetical protein [Myxococcales bacterium]